MVWVLWIALPSDGFRRSLGVAGRAGIWYSALQRGKKLNPGSRGGEGRSIVITHPNALKCAERE